MKNVTEPENATGKLQVTNIRWERIFLSFDIRSEIEDDLTFYLKRIYRRRPKPKRGQKKNDLPILKYVYEKVDIAPESLEKGMYHFTLNVAAVKGNEFLNNGLWLIQAYSEKQKKEYTCTATYELAYNLDNLSYIYPYAGGKFAYNVSFSTYSTDGELLTLVMNSRFLCENKKWRKRRLLKEMNNNEERFQRSYDTVVKWCMNLYYQVFQHLSPKKGKKILFMTETKSFLWGNLLYINNRLKERGLDKEFKITYSLRNAVGTNKGVFSWVKMITMIAKQDYIFVDDYVPVFAFLNMSRKTKLIQVWHAGEGFKAVGYCRFGKEGSPYPQSSCHKKYDYVITGSQRLVHVYGEVFGLPEKNFYPVGMARLDGFLDEEKISSFKKGFYEEHPDYIGKKIILFAPTYRGAEQKFAYYDFDRLDFDRIYDFCGDEYIWAFKMHPFVKGDIPVPEKCRDRIVDFSGYQNINDLYYITDILITDYSSAYYEYALMDRPVLFFTYDREAYELTRGVHKSVKDTAPGKVCDTFDEMMDALSIEDFEIEKTKAFRDENFSNYDGNAADKIIDTVLLNKTVR